MARYIDADLIIWHKQLESLGNGMYEDVRVAYMDHIDALRSANVRENRTGHWIPERLECTNGGSYQVYMCDQCKEAFNWRMNFCGSCGADMRGEQHGTDKE